VARAEPESVEVARKGAPAVFQRHALLWVCLAGLVLGGLGLANHELWTADEPRVAAIGVEMWHSGSYAVPQLAGQPFLEKPPLYWWAQAGLFGLFGHASAGVARLPSALFGWVALLLTYAWGRSFLEREAAALGALVFLTTSVVLVNAHWVIVDTALLAGTTGSLACLAAALAAEGPRRSALWAGMYLGLAAAFFAKGVVGVGLPVLSALVYLLWSRRWREVLGWHLLWGSLAVLALIALWLWRVYLDAGGEGVRTFLVYNQLGRFLPSLGDYGGGHRRPFYYYLRQTPADLLPWTPLLLPAGLALRRAWPRLVRRQREGLRLLLASAASVLLVLSAAGTKRGVYALPAVPPLCLLLGWWMAREPSGAAWERKLAWGWRGVLRPVAGIFAGAVAGIPLLRAVADLGEGSKPGVDVALGLGGVALVVAVAWGLRRLPERGPVTPWLRSVILVGVGWGLFLSTAWPAWDPLQTRRPVMDDVNAWVPREAPLHLYRTSESTLGLLGFYTGRRPLVVADAQGLAKLAGVSGRPWLLLEGKRGGGDYAALRDSGISYRVVRFHRSFDGREMWLVRLGDAGS